MIRGAYDAYAAVHCSTAAPTIRNCSIFDNASDGIQSFYSSGIPIPGGDSGAIHIKNCTISQNTGNGIDLNYSSARISGCDVYGNSAYGVFASNNSKIKMSDCILRGNGADGLYHIAFLGGYHVSNCTFVSNRNGLVHDGDFPKDGIVKMPYPDTSRLDKNIFAFNRERGVKAGWTPNYHTSSCNDSYGNSLGDYADTLMSAGDAYGNISADPLFCDTIQGNYKIATTSPCALLNNSCQVLMGKYGVGCSMGYLCGDANGDAGVDISDAVYLVAYIFAGGPAPDPLFAGDANCDMAVDISDAVYLIAYIFGGGPQPCAGCK
jgi:hypothetical protein